MIAVVRLSGRHCDDVARLHLGHLRSPLRGIPGQRLLRAYYATIAKGTGACGYVAEDDGAVVGYVCGIWEASKVYSTLLRRYWPELVAWYIAQLAIHPALIASCIGRIRGLLGRPDDSDAIGYELRPIVVAPAARGTGIAFELAATLLADAGRRGFQNIHLFTEVDNMAANAFYRKVGFLPTGSVCRANISYIRYELEIGQIINPSFAQTPDERLAQ